MFRIIVQVASPFGDDSESKTQVNGQKNTPKLLEFRGIDRFVIPLCFQWLNVLQLNDVLCIAVNRCK